ncbi:MAG: hypothetical protein JXR97_04580 [Planctomycetes bacterium]|nr:hypothetical protein [Planctomycetota bacterium]
MMDRKKEGSGPVPGDMAAYAVLAIALTVLGLAAYGSPSSQGHLILVVPLFIAIALHPFYAPTVRLAVTFVGYTILALPFGILSSVWEMEGSGGIIPFNEFFYISLYLVTLGIIKLYSEPDAERFPRVTLCSSMAFAMCGGDVNNDPYFILSIVYAIFVIWLLRATMKMLRRSDTSSKKSFYAFCISCFFLAFMWAAIAIPINRYYDNLNNLFFRWVRQMPMSSSAGFSDSSRLGSISNIRNSSIEKQIALRVFSSKEPGYMRGRVGISYGAGKWAGGLRDTEQTPDRGGDKNKATGRFVIPGRPAPDEFEESLMQVIPVWRYKAHFFLPLKATAVETSSERIILCAGNVIKAKFDSTTKGYGVFASNSPVYEKADSLARMPVANREQVAHILYGDDGIPAGKEMRKALDDKIREMQSRGLLKGKTLNDAIGDTLENKVEAVRAYFARYEYRIGITLNPTSPLWDFLVNKKHGHCELFASAGVLLLRRLEVPARYVTGFVCAEKNPYSDLWVARNKDAHAWVEYFDPATGWRTAEFTPASGVPEPDHKSGTDALLEYLGSIFEKMWAFLRREGIGGVLSYILYLVGSVGNWIIGSWWRTAIAAFLLGLFLYYRLFRNRKKRSFSFGGVREFPADIAAQREKFIALEKSLRRKHLGKDTSETLEEYAARIEKYEGELEDKDGIVEFVRKYADARYAPFEK